ncbi:FixH family protein [Sphingomonas sp. BN140010]|uniref:FixH family protein n=1 Tax=Sphingomonas arvum TaxID=2992113 RepID=A0ABT3JBH6_9SPHN|nr:FixH family protein [Sphingomonas sp. BN140010]MCW3796415.1 FixH family protein [Sphingomonas sp. BN140010]
MTAILVAFFGVVISVNMLMATLAVRTFGGVVVENSYVASQEYNRWLAAAKRQQALGWRIKPGVDAARRVTITVSVSGAEVSGYAEHPLGRRADVPLRFSRQDGGFVSDRPLPAGRWAVHLVVRKGADEARLVETLS